MPFDCCVIGCPLGLTPFLVLTLKVADDHFLYLISTRMAMVYPALIGHVWPEFGGLRLIIRCALNI